jgi:tetratricopeptide (TPR) repeat protein
VRRRILMVVMLVASWPNLALAADDPTASALVLQGGDLFKREDYEGARAAFARAYGIDPKAATLFDLALSELNAGRPVEAAAHLREYLTRADEPAAKLESVRTKWLPRAEARTARLDVFAPAGAQLAVDGAVAQGTKTTTGPTGAPMTSIAVAAGEHEVSARQGTLSETQHVTARGGELVELHFQRVAAAPAPAVAIGWTGNGEAHERAESGASRAKWITVVALGSAAVVAAGFGVGFGIAAANKASDAQNVQNGFGSAWSSSRCYGASAPPSCTQLASDVDSNRLNWGISAASYVGAGVLGAASFATWMLWKPKAGAIAARPMFDAQTGGVVVDGRW